MDKLIKFGAKFSPPMGWYPVIEIDGEMTGLQSYFKTKEQAGEHAKNWLLNIVGNGEDVKQLTPEEVASLENGGK